MQRSKAKFFTIVSLLIGLSASEKSFGVIIEPASATPQFLFHWAQDRHNLQHLKAAGFVPESVRPGYFGLLHATRRGRQIVKRLFTWTNPVASTMAATEESYVGEVLVRLEIDVAKARTIRIISDGHSHFYSRENTDIDLTNIDLVEHIHTKQVSSGLLKDYPRIRKQGKAVGDKVIWYREWVVLNKRCIKSFTANPNILRPIVKREMAKVEKRGFKFTDEDRFSFASYWKYAEGAFAKRSIRNIKGEYMSSKHHSNRCVRALSDY